MKVVVVLLALVGISTAKSICDKDINDVCGKNNLQIPATAEELSQLCVDMKAYFVCGIGYLTTCKNEQALEYFQKMVIAIRNVCQKESKPYLDLVESLPCLNLNQAAFKTECQYTNLTTSNYTPEEFYKEIGAFAGGELIENGFCMVALFEETCMILSIEKQCGEIARNAVTHVLQEYSKVGGTCTDEMVDKLPELIALLKRINDEHHIFII